ncbi:ATP-dependent Clp protease ATP-binding subunit [Candidatus Uhrbacteria bacterium]|jgi:ATP-dependent Clp protease ATP-binding subunit ClpC|nr:ATP-dependent Clp protease ATP-binding subunit [Candidatus Uhrbacteria bacterium]MBT7717646.1 ATP-dependent Clp protease ATP-binding subunit [Candidatus Uhrbacteria bacterium]
MSEEIEQQDQAQEKTGIPGLLVEGVFWHWKEKLTEPSIALGKVRNTIEKVINVIIGALLFASVVVVALTFILGDSQEVFTVEYWTDANTASLAGLFGLLCLQFLFFRFQDKKMSIKKLERNIEKIGEVQSIPSLDAVEKRKDIGSVITQDARNAIEDAYHIARKGGHSKVTAEHLFLGTISSRSISLLFVRLGISFDQMRDALRRRLSTLEKGNAVFGYEAQEVVINALHGSLTYRRPQVNAIEIFMAAYSGSEFIQELLFSLNIEPKALDNAVMWIRINEELRERYTEFRKAAGYKPTKGMDRAMTAVATPFLDKVSEDLTLSAVYGRSPMLIGRDREMDNLLRAIEGGRQSVVLTGQSGVGKDAIIYGLAQRMVEERVPKSLQDKRLVKISVPHIASSQGGSGAEERLLYVMSEVARAGNVILVIENIDQLVGGAGIDLSAVLSSELEKGYTFVIATTTPQAYSSNLELSALNQKLEKIVVEEPGRDEAIQVLESKIGGIENKEKVVFTYEAVAGIVDLSSRYMHDQYLPQKAIVLAQEVGHTVGASAQDWARVDKSHVAKMISDKTNIPVTQVSQEESQKLLNLEDRMHERIIGQDDAVKAVSSALRRARVELRSQSRPIANFLFLGPTGVGKTELAKTTAEVYFGNEGTMLRFDMSEYQDKASIARLIGNAGEGGLLTEAVRKEPFSLLLLDELEKAHPDILNLFLQVMDDGRLTDGAGRTVDFTNVILIATSNAGTQYIQDAVAKETPIEAIKQHLLEEELKTIYRPEFLNRFDGVMVFKPLSQEDVVAIAYLMIKKVTARLDAKGIRFEAADGAVHELAKLGYDPKFGARPLRRVIQERVDNSIAEFLLQGKVARRDTLLLQPGGEIEVQKAEVL